jgi:hypothetical protein
MKDDVSHLHVRRILPWHNQERLLVITGCRRSVWLASPHVRSIGRWKWLWASVVTRTAHQTLGRVRSRLSIRVHNAVSISDLPAFATTPKVEV